MSNKELGRFTLTGIRRAMAGVPQIEVTFTIDTDGIVSVGARDLDTGKAQTITITGSSNMSSADIERAMRDAENFAVAEKRAGSETELRDRAEHLLNRTKRLPHAMDRQQRGEIMLAADRLREAIKSGNAPSIVLASDELEAFLNATDV